MYNNFLRNIFPFFFLLNLIRNTFRRKLLYIFLRILIRRSLHKLAYFKITTYCSNLVKEFVQIIDFVISESYIGFWNKILVIRNVFCYIGFLLIVKIVFLIFV